LNNSYWYKMYKLAYLLHASPRRLQLEWPLGDSYDAKLFEKLNKTEMQDVLPYVEARNTYKIFLKKR